MKNIPQFLIWIIAVLFCSCNSNEESQNILLKEPFHLKDGLINIKHSNDKKILNKAYQIASKEQDDSLKNKMLLEISYQYLKINDSIFFLHINKEARNFSRSLNDSLGIAATYWDLGQYYHNYNIEDSAYFYYDKGQKLYESIGEDYNSARLMLNMAIIQKNIKDYTGSEITTVKAISLLKPLKKYKQLYAAYNNLGIVFNELGEYDRAIFYYNKGIEYLNKIEKKENFPSIWNNIGVVYSSKKKYDEAAKYYNQALSHNPNLEVSDPKLYAMLLDNKAYNQFKSGNTIGIYEQFQKSLNIREELKISPGIIINQLHLAEFFLDKKDTTNAIKYASTARELSSKTDNSRDFLASLKLLSAIGRDSALSYSQQYIRINDSLQKEERTIRNKFARIRFETDEYISETGRLNQRILRISIIALTIIIIFVLLYIIKDQRSKNRLVKQKQHANQEIYNLILAQQKNFEEGREKEKQHISRELHDGILGKLFGVRLSLDSLNEENAEESKKKRFEYIEEIQRIGEEIRVVSHRLNKSSLIDIDFKTVLEELIEKQHRGIKLQLEVNNSIIWEDIGNDIKINIYRIIQEALNNIHKHSKATKAKVEIRKINKKLILQVRDNGIGFNYDESKKGIGLKNMKDRSRNVNGQFSIKPGIKGTLIKVIINM